MATYFYLYFSDLIPIIFLLINNRQLRKNNTRLWVLFLFYLIYSLLNNIILILLPNPFLFDEAIFYKTFTIVECIVISYFFYNIIQLKFLKGIVFLLSTLALAFFLFRLTFLKNTDTLGSLEISISSIQTIIYSLFYLYERIQKPSSLLLYNTTEFWFVTGLLVYFSGTFFIFIYTQNYQLNDDFRELYNIINSSLYLVKNLLVTIGLLVNNKPLDDYEKSDSFFTAPTDIHKI